METLRLVLLVLHILGFAALIGGLLAQAGAGEKKITGPMRDGIGTAFVTGLALVGVLESGDDAVNHAKVGVKLVIALVILVLVMANLRKPSIPQGPLGRAPGPGGRQRLRRGLLVPGPRLSATSTRVGRGP